MIDDNQARAGLSCDLVVILWVEGGQGCLVDKVWILPPLGNHSKTHLST